MVYGMVNAEPGYPETTNVISGFSDFVVDVFGRQIGEHARMAVGMATLPLNQCVLVGAELEIARSPRRVASANGSNRSTPATAAERDGSQAAALARDERELARYLFSDRTPAEVRAFEVGFDQLLRRLNEPDFQTMRRAAFGRWPLATKTRRTRGRSTSP